MLFIRLADTKMLRSYYCCTSSVPLARGRPRMTLGFPAEDARCHSYHTLIDYTQGWLHTPRNLPSDTWYGSTVFVSTNTAVPTFHKTSTRAREQDGWSLHVGSVEVAFVCVLCLSGRLLHRRSFGCSAEPFKSVGCRALHSSICLGADGTSLAKCCSVLLVSCRVFFSIPIQQYL